MRLDQAFFCQDAITLAKKLLGKGLVREVDGQRMVGRIVETEAYVGPEDKGCHAYNNRKTKRTETMFLEGGHAYIYMIYGMYYCLNVVAAKKDKPEAVLIRAIEPIEGLASVRRNRKIKSTKPTDLTNGPGKLCQAFAIDKSLNGCHMALGHQIYIVELDQEEPEIVSGPRINIDYAQEYKEVPWRFYIKDHPYVSR